MAFLGVLGFFGKVPFTCSSEQVATFKDLGITHSSRYATHDVIGEKPVSEYIGPSKKEISFKMTLSAQYNSPPLLYVTVLKNMLESGESHHLCFGPEYMGKFILTGFKEDRKFFNGQGIPIVTDVSLTLIEDESTTLLSTLKNLLN